MEKDNAKKYLDAISMLLILSYFILHYIVFVFIGILFSLYSLNSTSINGLILSITRILNKKISISNKFDQLESTKKDYKLSLVEEVEEYGFIPSPDKEDNSKVA